jgi:radical SAM superfamily enzyme YgiQ (UPF0313 family)
MGAVDPMSADENKYPPLWPAYLAANVDKQIGPDKIDCRFMSGRIEDALKSFRPDVLAVSSVTPNYDYAIHHARAAKQRGIPVIIGGMHISSLPETLTKDMDVGCIGEGEETFVDLMNLYLDKGVFDPQDLSGIKGLVYRKDGTLLRTPDRHVIESIDQIPHPKRSIIGYGRRTYVYTARGCQYKCTFCICNRYWGKIRYASPQYILEEIEELVRNGVEVIKFSDENFIGNKERLAKIADMVISEGINKKVKFSCWARAQNVTPDVVRMLKAINVVSVKMGLESGSQRVLKAVKGNTTIEDSKRAINLLKDAGIQANGGFMIGFPDETKEEIMETYNFVKHSRLDFVDINTICPLPATEIWEYAERQGLVSAQMDWTRFHYKFTHNRDRDIVLSKTLTHEQLSRLHRKFGRLSTLKTAKALIKTPWRKEIPKMALGIMVEKIWKIGTPLKNRWIRKVHQAS